ncbi:MAG TPA: hypothetical protein VFY05_12035 [Candidatus Angelobacter sp.]|nr:hypothetical protein [Candidatus Angelobacter sp.]
MLLFFSAGCSHSMGPTPQGGFSNASLDGTYSFSFSGTDANGRVAVAGMLAADGAGKISKGMLDINQQGSAASNGTFTGTYTIAADGRGTATLSASAGNFTLAFVVVSSSRALVIRFEQAATGTGAMDLVNSSAFSTTALSGTLVFNLSGLDASAKPLATVGSITTDATGTVTSGVQDTSDNGSIVTAQPISAGTLQVASTGRGTASITTAAGPLNFVFYVVDANHIKLVETDKLPALAGDAFRQTGPISNASLTGPFAFTAGGTDTANGSSLGGAFATGAVLTTDGAGTISSGSADINDAGSPTTNIAITGTYALDASGRGTATLSSTTAGSLNFVIYPTVNGVQLLDVDSGRVVSGAAFAQTGTPFTNAVLRGTYALSFSETQDLGAVDVNAALAFDGIGRINGLTDINALGSVSTGTSMTGTFVMDQSGHGSMLLESGLGPQNMAIYTVSGSRCLFIGVDSGTVVIGDIESN